MNTTRKGISKDAIAITIVMTAKKQTTALCMTAQSLIATEECIAAAVKGILAIKVQILSERLQLASWKKVNNCAIIAQFYESQ